jgi:TonB family protein
MKTRLSAVCVSVFGATSALAQLPDSVVRARMDSSSICPSVSVHANDGLLGGSINMSPIMHHVDNRDLGFGFAIGVAPGIGEFGMVSFLSMSEDAPRYEKAHDIMIVADDSIRLSLATTYQRIPPGSHIESIDARIPESGLARLSGVKRITIALGSESYPLSVGQLQAVEALLAERDKPLSNRDVATGCIGPTAAELQSKWATERRGTTGPTYFEFQVEKPAAVFEQGSLEYPQVMKKAGVSGDVLAQFVVLENGTADMDTFKVLRSSNELFTASVRNAVPKMKFLPAEIGGKKVRQLVQLPFVFNATRTSPSSAMVQHGDTIVLPSGVIIRRVATPDSLSKWGKATFALPASTSTTIYTEAQVDKPVRNPNGGPLPKTVPAEVVAMFGGEQLLEFVVNADGNVVPGTVRVIRADPRVDSAQAGNLSEMHFIPAELHGERVRQIVQLAMPVGIRKN